MGSTENEKVIHAKTRAEQALLGGLVEHGYFIPSGVQGVYGRGAKYEAVLEGFNGFLSRAVAADAPTRVHFPPIMPRKNLERIGYLESFPHLAGLVFSFEGSDADHLKLISHLQHGTSYEGTVKMTDVVLNSATCQPLYPSLTGRLPQQGGLFDLNSYCFRHEPSDDPIRMQSFRMREHVRLGTKDEVLEWRERWLGRARDLFESIGLEVTQEVATDPFFGRGGKMLAANQRDSEQKFEFATSITSDRIQTAIMSFNYHEDHFTSVYDIATHDGATAQSGCLGIGVERIAIALINVHGFDLKAWPNHVQQALGL